MLKATIWLIALMLVVVGCDTTQSDGASATELRTNQSQAFTFDGSDGLRVVGAPGVAPADTPVSITPQTRPTTTLSDGRIRYLGRSAEIELGNGLQPNAPISVSAPIPADARQNNHAIVGVTEREGKPEFLPVTVTGDRMTTTMTHLSPLDFFTVDFGAVAHGISESVNTALTGESSAVPECVGKTVEADGVKFTAARTVAPNGSGINAVWPCLRTSGRQIFLDLHANGDRAWLARTLPDVGEGQSTAPSSGDATASGFFALYQRLAMRGRSTGRLMPNTTLTFAFSADNPPTRAEVRVDPGLLLMSAAMYEVTALMDVTGLSIYDKMEKAPGTYDCIVSASNTMGSDRADAIASFSSAFKTALTCMTTAVPGPMAFMLNIFSGGAGVISGLLTGAWNEIIGNNHGIIRITSTGQQAMNSTAFVGEWIGHGRKLVLNKNGTAVVTYFSGAMNGEEWSAVWKPTSAGITVTLRGRNSITGDGLPATLHSGLTATGVLERPTDGPLVLKFTEPDGNSFYWCSTKSGYNYRCGA